MTETNLTAEQTTLALQAADANIQSREGFSLSWSEQQPIFGAEPLPSNVQCHQRALSDLQLRCFIEEALRKGGVFTADVDAESGWNVRLPVDQESLMQSLEITLQSTYPSLDHLSAHQDARINVEEFMEFLHSKGIFLASYEGEWLHTVNPNMDSLFMESIGLDPKQVERERQALLNTVGN